MDMPSWYSIMATLPGCDTFDRQGLLKYVTGHTHCNHPLDRGGRKIQNPAEHPTGFMTAGFGMSDCQEFGMPILDTTENLLRLWYFDTASVHKKDMVVDCVSTVGWRQCTHLARLWMKQPLPAPRIRVTAESPFQHSASSQQSAEPFAGDSGWSSAEEAFAGAFADNKDDEFRWIQGQEDRPVVPAPMPPPTAPPQDPSRLVVFDGALGPAQPYLLPTTPAPTKTTTTITQTTTSMTTTTITTTTITTTSRTTTTKTSGGNADPFALQSLKNGFKHVAMLPLWNGLR